MLKEGYPTHGIRVAYCPICKNGELIRRLVENGMPADDVLHDWIPKDAKLLRYLLEKGAHFNPAHNMHLFQAITDGDEERVKVLLEFGILQQEDIHGVQEVLLMYLDTPMSALVEGAVREDRQTEEAS